MLTYIINPGQNVFELVINNLEDPGKKFVGQYLTEAEALKKVAIRYRTYIADKICEALEVMEWDMNIQLNETFTAKCFGEIRNELNQQITSIIAAEQLHQLPDVINAISSTISKVTPHEVAKRLPEISSSLRVLLQSITGATN